MLAEPTTAVPVLYCTFWIGERQFGVPALLVKEVHAPTATTPIPGAPRAVRGYVNLRGNLYLLLDPGELLTADSAPVAADGDFIVFKAAAGENFAIQTDRVGDIVAVRGDQVAVPKTEAGQLSERQRAAERLIVGHAKLDHTLLTLVDPRELLSAVFSEGIKI
jgi:chemotaxis signal transduction protein